MLLILYVVNQFRTFKCAKRYAKANNLNDKPTRRNLANFRGNLKGTLVEGGIGSGSRGSLPMVWVDVYLPLDTRYNLAKDKNSMNGIIRSVNGFKPHLIVETSYVELYKRTFFWGGPQKFNKLMQVTEKLCSQGQSNQEVQSPTS